MDGLTASVMVLWVLVLALAVLVWALSRQVGVLFERVAPMGALMTDAGPAVGSASPTFDLPVLSSSNAVPATVRIGGAQGMSTLLFFLSPTCPVCKKLLPVVRSLVRDESQWRVVLASDGAQEPHRAFIAEQGLQHLPYVLSTELGMTYRVSRLPYAVVLNPQGVVTAKGLVNSREQLDSLLNAHDMGTPSIQQYLHQQAV